jgi:hypothetical protein
VQGHPGALKICASHAMVTEPWEPRDGAFDVVGRMAATSAKILGELLGSCSETGSTLDTDKRLNGGSGLLEANRGMRSSVRVVCLRLEILEGNWSKLDPFLGLGADPWLWGRAVSVAEWLMQLVLLCPAQGVAIFLGIRGKLAREQRGCKDAEGGGEAGGVLHWASWAKQIPRFWAPSPPSLP